MSVAFLLSLGCGMPVNGLKPESPSGNLAQFIEVNGLQPVLRWEAFPTIQDRRADQDGWLTRIQNISYDIRIFRSEEDYPGDLVYRREALPERWHRVEEPLTPASRYFWTVRARFELEGEPRVTEWASIIPVGHALNLWAISHRMRRIPNPFYYRFQTRSRQPDALSQSTGPRPAPID